MRRNYSESSFLQNWARILIWININFIKIYRRTIYKTDNSKISNLLIFAFIFCVDLVTLESLWRHKGVAMHVTYKTMHRFSTMHDSPPPASERTSPVNFGFIMYQNQIIHVIIGFLRDHSDVRQCTRRYAPRALTDPRGPFVPPISQLGDNDRAARVLFVQHPREQGEWCPAPEGAGRTTPEQTGHYSHYNTKLTNSRYFHGNSPHSSHWTAVAAILFLEIQWALSPPLYLNENNRTDCTKGGHKLTCWIRCVCLQVLSPCVDLCLMPNELL